jgi:DNA-directed RNA polymerase specialized sigma24 family protein
MTEQGWLAEQFEQNRQHLQAVAYGMLGSVSEAQDAVQEAFPRYERLALRPVGVQQFVWLRPFPGATAPSAAPG